MRDLALAQLASLEDDDVDGYLASEGEYATAIAACLDNPGGLTPGQLQELTTVALGISARLAAMKADVASQLAEASARRRANNAYLAPPLNVSFDARSA